MSLTQQVQAALVGVAPGSVFRGVAGQGAVAPYVVWQRLVSPVNNTLDGPSNLQNTRVQVDVYASRFADLESIEAAVLAAMQSAPVSAIQLSSQDFYEQETKLYRTSIDFSCWST